MTGRNISVTHEALGTTRVMKTCGMMGEVVGRATSICKLRECSPRDVYEKYWDEMDKLLKLPGKAHRATVSDTFEIPADSMQLASSIGVVLGVDPAKLPGSVMDNLAAKKKGKWKSGTNLKGYINHDYVYASENSEATMAFEVIAPDTGICEIRIAYQPHQNRGSKVPISIKSTAEEKEIAVNMKQAPGKDGFFSLGEFELKKGEVVSVEFSTKKLWRHCPCRRGSNLASRNWQISNVQIQLAL